VYGLLRNQSQEKERKRGRRRGRGRWNSDLRVLNSEGGA